MAAKSELYTKNPKTPKSGQNPSKANPSKFHNRTHILYKVLTAIFILVILPLIPSQAPDFINQTLLTRSWELLHLLFVGIAVSYGLFSRRNDEKKENEMNSSKFDNAQSYVSGLLQVPSVFDVGVVESETPDETLAFSDDNKVQTWKSRYVRNEPVVVSEKRPGLNEQTVRNEKPLLLPVRSLKSRVIDDDDDDDDDISVSGSKSIAGSKRFFSKLKRSSNEKEFGKVDSDEMEENLNENVVLRSPIPWRSRSGRMEMKEEDDDPPIYPAMEEPLSGSSKSQISRSSRPITTAPKLSPSPSPSPSLTPRKSPPLPTVSPESQAKSAEDLVWKKSFYRSTPPPPPPPLPPSVRRISSMKQSSYDMHREKDLRRSFTSKPRDRIRDMDDDDMIIGTNSSVEVMPRTYVDSQSMGKSMRKTRGGEALTEPPRRGREFGRNELMDQNVQDFEENPIEFHDEVKEEIIGKVVMETDDDMESDEEDDMGAGFLREENEGKFTVSQKDNEGSSNDEEAASSSMANDGGPDVDKKADEFIAKFREQIRLQRIESIKRSSGQIRRNSSRQT